MSYQITKFSDGGESTDMCCSRTSHANGCNSEVHNSTI